MTHLELANLIIKESRNKWFFYSDEKVQLKAFNLWVQLLKVGNITTDVSGNTQKAFRVNFVQTMERLEALQLKAASKPS